MLCGMDMPRRNRSGAKGIKEPRSLTEDTGSRPRALSKQELDFLASNIKKGIRDTPVWKDLVRRVGKAEAERILKLALYHEHGIAGNADN